MFERPTNINQKNFLLILYVVMLGVFGPAIYWISNSESKFPFISNKVEKKLPQARTSIGDRILVTAHSNAAKQSGIQAYAKGDYLTAEANFRASLNSDRNDPEAVIYLNNAIAAKTETSYRIGVSVPIGGNLGVAEEILRGVAQAQTEINSSGGIDGKLLTVKIANDDNNPELAQEIADNFVRDRQVLAVVGHNSSNASIAAAPVYEEAGVVMITPTSSAESLSTMGRHIFRTAPSTRALTDVLADYTVNTAGKTNIGICVDSEAKASLSFQENFTWAIYNYGGKVAPLNCNLAAANLDADNIISQAISQGIDALLLAPSVRRVDKAMKLVMANDDRLTLLGNHSLNTYTTLQEGKEAVNGMVMSVAWYPQSRDNTFVENARQLWRGGVNWRTAMAYDATTTLAKAISFGAEREAVRQALANPKFSAEGATTDVNFLPSGDRNLKGTLIKIEPGNKTGTGYDFVALKKQPLNEQHRLTDVKSNPGLATTSSQSLPKQTNKLILE